MRNRTAILAIAAAVSLGGCSFRKQPPTVSAAPPAPKPAAPPKPVEPLSIPQTSVELPPPQPVPPESLPPPEPGTPPPPATTPATRPTNRPRPAPAPPRAEPQTPPAPAAVTPPPAEPARPPIVEALPAAELKRLQDETHSRVQETRQLMGRISARRLRQQDSLVKRIDSFLTQAQDAERRNDMQQATELAGRALVLARELRP